METDIQRFERLCKEAGIPSTTTNFYLDSPDRLYNFYKAVVQDISKELQRTIEKKEEVEDDDEPLVEEKKPSVEEKKPSVEEKKPSVEEKKPSVDEPETIQNPTDKCILSKLERYKDKKPLTTKELSNLCKVSVRTVQERTKKLHEKGFIRPGGPDSQIRRWTI